MQCSGSVTKDDVGKDGLYAGKGGLKRWRKKLLRCFTSVFLIRHKDELGGSGAN